MVSDSKELNEEIEHRLCLNCSRLVNIRYQLKINRENKIKTAKFSELYEVEVFEIFNKSQIIKEFKYQEYQLCMVESEEQQPIYLKMERSLGYEKYFFL